MPEEPPQEGTPPDPQEGNGTPDAPDADSGDGQKAFDADYVRKLRSENAAYRKRAQEAEGRVAAFEQSQLSEAEKAQARIAELEKQNQALLDSAHRDRLERQVALAAPKYGIVDPDAAVRLLDIDRLDVADDGTINNLDDTLKNLIKDRPWLVGTQRGSGGGGARPQQPATSMNDVIRQAAGRH